MSQDLFYNSMISGGIARGITILKLYPLDTYKTNLQSSNKIIIKNYRNYYNGLSLTMFSQIPYYMIVFGSYELIKKQYYSRNNVIDNIKSAFIADFLGAIWLTPFEIYKQKKQNNKKIYCFKNINYYNNCFLSLILRDIPFRIIKLPLYEYVKNKYVPNNRNIYVYESLLYGSVIGMCAAAITNPADVIKTNVIISEKSVKSIIKDIIYNKGISTFSKGITYRVLYTGLANGIFFSYYEYLKSIITI
jgi:hypothetical protein|tara:strand:- start:15486 stop:16226 length:741 start_codon:yes stop_codon:yes gene_type:complete